MEDDDTISEERLEEIVQQACEPGLPPDRRAGKLLAGWRSYLGTEGPGVLTRLMMARQTEMVIRAALQEFKEKAAQTAWGTTVPLGNFGTEKRNEFAILNMTSLQLEIARRIRELE